MFQNSRFLSHLRHSQNRRCHLLYFIVFLLIFSGLLQGADTRPQRIVSLSPAMTEMICQLGAETMLVGRTDACNYPKSIQKLPIAGGFGSPNLERIAMLNPTLVIANSIFPVGLEKMLSELGVELIVKPCSTLDDYRDCVLLLGKVLNHQDDAKKELERSESIKKLLEKRAASIPSDQRVNAVWIVWDSPLMLASNGSLPDSILKLIGCNNLAAGGKQPYLKPSFEYLATLDPAVIIWPDLTPEKERDISSSNPWKELRAVKQKHLIRGASPDVLLRPGPRLFDGMIQLQNVLYPSRNKEK